MAPVEPQLFKVVFIKDDVTRSGLRYGEVAGYPLEVAARLVAEGVCRVADDEPWREAVEQAARSYRIAKPRGPWELALVRRGYFDNH